ncbi:hypothetical protein JCM8547_003138 [Rhodosporidiobolus lusitaniae]
MAARSALLPLVRALSLSRTPTCTCAAVPRPASSSSRLFATSSSNAFAPEHNRQSSGGDSYGSEDRTGSTGDRPPSRKPRSPHGRNAPSRSSPSSSSSSRRYPPKKRFKQKQAKEDTGPPPLPPLNPLPSLDALDPTHLHAFRLSVSTALGRLPSQFDLEKHLRRWLAAQHRQRAAEAKAAAREAERKAAKREQLDIAWEWQRQVEENIGLARNEAQAVADKKTLERLRERWPVKQEMERRKKEEEIERIWSMRKEKKAGREDKEAEVWAKALGVDEMLEKEQKKAEEFVRAKKERRESKHWAEELVEQEKEKKRDDGRPLPEWKRQQLALRQKFPEGWEPPKRISREAMDLIRELAASDRTKYTAPVLAARFKISPEAVRRILKSRFELSPAERAKREARRREERARSIAESAGRDGSAEGEVKSAWGGDVAAEKREMQGLRSRTAHEEQQREP